MPTNQGEVGEHLAGKKRDLPSWQGRSELCTKCQKDRSHPALHPGQRLSAPTCPIMSLSPLYIHIHSKLFPSSVDKSFLSAMVSAFLACIPTVHLLTCISSVYIPAACLLLWVSNCALSGRNERRYWHAPCALQLSSLTHLMSDLSSNQVTSMLEPTWENKAYSRMLFKAPLEGAQISCWCVVQSPSQSNLTAEKY